VAVSRVRFGRPAMTILQPILILQPLRLFPIFAVSRHTRTRDTNTTKADPARAAPNSVAGLRGTRLVQWTGPA
jgi:hypothetical protein